MAVLGVDACKEGWVGIVLAAGVPPRAVCASHIGELVDQAGPVEVVAIDIPIGLPASTTRRCDSLAKQALGRKGSSVFLTPVRRALEAPDYPTANLLSRADTGMGISKQAWHLAPKVLQVDDWLRTTDQRTVEAHPELSFLALAGGAPVLDGKTTWAGTSTRRALLSAAGIELDGDLGLARRKAGIDDVLDAAAVAWTAMRVLDGTAECRPDPPEPLGPTERPAAIWT